MKPKRDKEFTEKVIKVNRITRVVKGGRRMRFRATVAIGNHRGQVGIAVAKANEVSDAVAKAVSKAKNNLITIPIQKDTIPHTIHCKFGSSQVLLKPAVAGTGVIAGGAVREILEISGIKNIVGKNIGSTNKINSSKATIKCLSSLRNKEHIFASRGKSKPVTPPTTPTPETPATPKKPTQTKKSN